MQLLTPLCWQKCKMWENKQRVTSSLCLCGKGRTFCGQRQRVLILRGEMIWALFLWTCLYGDAGLQLRLVWPPYPCCWCAGLHTNWSAASKSHRSTLQVRNEVWVFCPGLRVLIQKFWLVKQVHGFITTLSLPHSDVNWHEWHLQTYLSCCSMLWDSIDLCP